MTQLHLFARFDGERGHLLGSNLGNKFGDAPGDLDSVFVELRLPQQTREHGAPELHLRREVARWRAFVRAPQIE